MKDVHTFRNISELTIYEQYGKYIYNIKAVIYNLTKKLTVFKTTQEVLLKQLFENAKYEYLFEDYSTFRKKDFKTCIDLKVHQIFAFKAYVRLHNTELSTLLGTDFINYATDKVFELIVLNIRIKYLKDLIKKFVQKLVPFKVYTAICKLYNQRLCTLLIENLYVFKVGHGVSKIKAVKQKYFPKKLLDGTWSFPVHFPKTKANKEALIKGGCIPYTKELFPDGKHYTVYITEGYRYWIHWYKGHCIIPERKGYHFNIISGLGFVNPKTWTWEKYRAMQTVSYHDLAPKVKLWWLKKYKPEVLERYPLYIYKEFELEEGMKLRGYNCHINPEDVPLQSNVYNDSFPLIEKDYELNKNKKCLFTN